MHRGQIKIIKSIHKEESVYEWIGEHRADLSYGTKLRMSCKKKGMK